MSTEEKKHHKHYIHFHLSKLLEHKGVRIGFVTALFALVVIITVLICVINNDHKKIKEYKRAVKVLDESLDTAKSDVENLSKQIEDLSAKNAAMGESLQSANDDLAALQEVTNKEKIPTAYPLKGTAAIVNVALNEEGNAVTVNQIGDDPDITSVSDNEVMFTVSTDTNVIATASGNVTELLEDSTYGYIIRIDHGNGYESLYKGMGVPLVSVGDYVCQGSVIMKIAAENSAFLYQIIKDGSFIDPMTCMDING